MNPEAPEFRPAGSGESPSLTFTFVRPGGYNSAPQPPPSLPSDPPDMEGRKNSYTPRVKRMSNGPQASSADVFPEDSPNRVLPPPRFALELPQARRSSGAQNDDQLRIEDADAWPTLGEASKQTTKAGRTPFAAPAGPIPSTSASGSGANQATASEQTANTQEEEVQVSPLVRRIIDEQVEAFRQRLLEQATPTQTRPDLEQLPTQQISPLQQRGTLPAKPQVQPAQYTGEIQARILRRERAAKRRPFAYDSLTDMIVAQQPQQQHEAIQQRAYTMTQHQQTAQQQQHLSQLPTFVPGNKPVYSLQGLLATQQSQRQATVASLRSAFTGPQGIQSQPFVASRADVPGPDAGNTAADSGVKGYSTQGTMPAATAGTQAYTTQPAASAANTGFQQFSTHTATSAAGIPYPVYYPPSEASTSTSGFMSYDPQAAGLMSASGYPTGHAPYQAYTAAQAGASTSTPGFQQYNTPAQGYSTQTGTSYTAAQARASTATPGFQQYNTPAQGHSTQTGASTATPGFQQYNTPAQGHSTQTGASTATPGFQQYNTPAQGHSTQTGTSSAAPASKHYTTPALGSAARNGASVTVPSVQQFGAQCQAPATTPQYQQYGSQAATPTAGTSFQVQAPPSAASFSFQAKPQTPVAPRRPQQLNPQAQAFSSSFQATSQTQTQKQPQNESQGPPVEPGFTRADLNMSPPPLPVSPTLEEIWNEGVLHNANLLNPDPRPLSPSQETGARYAIEIGGLGVSTLGTSDRNDWLSGPWNQSDQAQGVQGEQGFRIRPRDHEGWGGWEWSMKRGWGDEKSEK